MFNIKEIEKSFKEEIPTGKLIYLTLGGSHLFGLNNEKSDIDIKGIFLQSETDTRNYNIPDYLNLSTNKSNLKNSTNDVDIELFSLEKYFHLISTGDTNAYDLLFSMFSPSVLIETKESKIIKNNYRNLLSTNSKAFLGYVVSQTKKYGVKGERYHALTNFVSILKDFMRNYKKTDKVNVFIDFLETQELPYVKSILVEKEDNIGGGRYIEVLNKRYRESITFEYFLDRLEERLTQYGERSKKASEGIDFKSLSHAYRIVLQFRELLETHFIKFPSDKKESILKIKNGDLSEFGDYENLLLFLDNEVNYIENNLNGMTSFVDRSVFNKIFIEILAACSFEE